MKNYKLELIEKINRKESVFDILRLGYSVSPLSKFFAEA